MVMSLSLLPIGRSKFSSKLITHLHTRKKRKIEIKPRIRLKHNNNTVAVRGRGGKNVEEGACGDTTDGMVIECDEVTCSVCK